MPWIFFGCGFSFRLQHGPYLHHSIGPAAPFWLIFKLADYFGAEDRVIFLKPEDSVELQNLHRRAAAVARSRELIPRHEGKVESCDSHRQALERELAEELGIVVAVAHCLETLRVQISESGSMECRLYVVTEWKGTPANQQPDEHSEIRWFRFEEARHLKLAAPEYVRIMESLGQHKGTGAIFKNRQ